MKTKKIKDLMAPKKRSFLKVTALISGGKDSIYALDLAIKQGHEPVCLVAIKSKNPESYMFHVPAIEVVKLQAEAMQIPLIFYETDGVKEEELKDLKEALDIAKQEYGAEAVVSGALASTYKRDRIEALCDELDLKSLCPLWGARPINQWREMLKTGYKIVISGVAADGLTIDWLGKEVDETAVLQLCNLHKTCYICTGGEGGEFETLVLDCPLFKNKQIKLIQTAPFWDEKTQSGELEVKGAELISK